MTKELSCLSTQAPECRKSGSSMYPLNALRCIASRREIVTDTSQKWRKQRPSTLIYYREFRSTCRRSSQGSNRPRAYSRRPRRFEEVAGARGQPRFFDGGGGRAV